MEHTSEDHDDNGEKKTVKRLFKILGAIAIVLAIPAIIKLVMFRDKPDEKRAMLARLVAETKPTLPKKVDEVTTWTDVEADLDTWRYHYTLSDRAKLDPYSQGTYRKMLVDQVCGSDARKILAQKITIEYVYTYQSSVGEEKMRITIPPGSC